MFVFSTGSVSLIGRNLNICVIWKLKYSVRSHLTNIIKYLNESPS